MLKSAGEVENVLNSVIPKETKQSTDIILGVEIIIKCLTENRFLTSKTPTSRCLHQIRN